MPVVLYSVILTSSSFKYNLLGILIILTIYKCRNFGQFSPTFVHTQIIKNFNDMISSNSLKILVRDSAIYFITIFGQSVPLKVNAEKKF
jgi:hypothetical protein